MGRQPDTDYVLKSGLATTALARRVRDSLVRLVNNLPSVKDQLARILAEVNVSYRKSPIVAERPYLGTFHIRDLKRQRAFFSGPKAGDRAPDARLRRSDESVERLHMLLQGTGFHLLYFANTAKVGKALAEPGARLLAAVRARFGDHVSMIEITPGPSTAGRGHVQFRDDGDSTRKAYGAAGECLYLIRPDGYISFRALSGEPEALLRHIEGIVTADAGAGPLPADEETAVAGRSLMLGVSRIGAALLGVGFLMSGKSPRDRIAGPGRTLALLLAGVFTLSGAAKLLISQPVREGFARWDYPPVFMVAVGLWELGSAFALANGGTRKRGGQAAAALMVGAAGTHLRAKEYPHILPAVVLMGLAFWVARKNQPHVLK